MKKRSARRLFVLFRRRTRDRYRSEFEDLLDELEGAGETPRHLVVEVFIAAIGDRVEGLRRLQPIVLGVAVVLAATLALGTWALQNRTSTIVGSVSPYPHPIDVPSAPQLSAEQCPTPAQFSSPLPAGTTVVVSLGPSSSDALTFAGGVLDGSGECEYSLTFANG